MIHSLNFIKKKQIVNKKRPRFCSTHYESGFVKSSLFQHLSINLLLKDENLQIAI